MGCLEQPIVSLETRRRSNSKSRIKKGKQQGKNKKRSSSRLDWLEQRIVNLERRKTASKNKGKENNKAIKQKKEKQQQSKNRRKQNRKEEEAMQ